VNTVVPLLATLLLATAAPPATAAESQHCGALRVPGAQHEEQITVPDLTTAGGQTVPADWAGLTPSSLPTPTAVPGVQIDGYFPDDSTTNTNHGWNHDSQFVIRLPENWNGGVVVTGSPGVRRQYANDRAISDWVLSRGYAFAATDKGNTGAEFFRDGRAIEEWNQRLTQLARAAKTVAAQRYCRQPSHTIVTGMSNGGYLVRWQLENHPELYDAGVDWEGTLWTTPGPNLLTFLPPVLREYPKYTTGSSDAHARIVDAGFPAGSEFLWDFHYKYYWDLTQRIYREELDPRWDASLEAGVPFCASGTPNCDADYTYSSRPSAWAAVHRIALTGRIGKPLITLHGTLDVLLPISKDSDVYADMVRRAGRADMFRYYRVEGGTHVDSLFDTYPDRLRPLTPCHRSAFEAMEKWIGSGVEPPASKTVPMSAVPSVNTCDLT
jgi:dienelactone hydrolase